MPKDKLTDYSATNASNTDVGGVNIDEGMLPSAVNNSIRELMTHQKEAFGSGTPLYVDQTNDRLGVATASPSKTLHVSSNAFTYPARITQTGGTTVGLEFTNTGSGANPPVVGSKSDDIFFETSNSERARILSSGGITFNGDTAAANALDDYEEGTFTPALNGEGACTITTSSASGYYTKVGRFVHVNMFFQLSAVSGGSSSLAVELANLPFNTNSAQNVAGSVRVANLGSSVEGVQVIVFNNSDGGRIEEFTGIGGTNLSNHLASNTNFQVTLGYST
jgi:hypothetical protein